MHIFSRVNHDYNIYSNKKDIYYFLTNFTKNKEKSINNYTLFFLFIVRMYLCMYLCMYLREKQIKYVYNRMITYVNNIYSFARSLILPINLKPDITIKYLPLYHSCFPRKWWKRSSNPSLIQCRPSLWPDSDR